MSRALFYGSIAETRERSREQSRIEGFTVNRFPEERLDLFETESIFETDERESSSLSTRPRGTPDSVNVGWRIFGQVDVHDKIDVLDVETPRGQIRRE